MNEILALNKNWTLSYNGEKIAANVPGDITWDLFTAGKIPDPYSGLNHKELHWIIATDFEYSTIFDLSQDLLVNQQILLQLDSVDTFADIYLNDRYIGSTKNMFLQYEFDITESVKVNGNKLVVKMLSTKHKMDSIDDTGYFGVFNNKRLFIRKAQCHFGWDWAPDMPGYGICGQVRVKGARKNRMDNVTYRAFNDGSITLFAELNYTIRPQINFQGKLICDTNKDCREDVLRYTIATEPNKAISEVETLTEERKISGKKNFVNFKLNNPELWQPNGYGEHPLYAYKVELLRNGEVVDEICGKFAFREVSLVQKPLDSDTIGYKLVVNGNEVFVKGSNWVPVECFTGRNTEQKYTELVEKAVTANLNMLRVWGGGIYEQDKFYELCDEHGIMVWQDIMLACADIPEDDQEFVENVKAEIKYQIKRLRNHPSIVYWCGGNEKTGTYGLQISHGDYFVDVILRGLVQNLDDSRPYSRQSPCSLTDIGNDKNSGESHAGSYEAALVEGVLNYRNLVASSVVPFVSECATMSVGSVQSLKRIFPEDKLWPTNEYWNDRLMDNPYSAVEMNFVDRQKLYADTLYGQSRNVSEFTIKSMTAHSESIRAELEYARVNKKKCGGFMNWMYSDIWPSATWSVVDYYGEEKAAYYQLKRSFQPLLLTFAQLKNGTVLAVVNETKNAFVSEVTYGLKTLDGKVLWQHSVTVNVRQNDVETVSVTDKSDLPNTYLFAECEADGQKLSVAYSYDMWHSCKFVSDYDYTILKKDDCYAVTFTAKQFAKSVTLSLPDNYKYRYSDNYFDLQAGEQKTVYVYGKINPDNLVVTDLAKIQE